MPVEWNEKKVNEMIARGLRDTLVQGAALAEAEAKRACPVRTGRLKNSIHAVLPDSFDSSYPYTDDQGRAYDGALEMGTKPTEAIVGTNVEYAFWVEAGTSRMQGRHYLRHALEVLASKGWEVKFGP